MFSGYSGQLMLGSFAFCGYRRLHIGGIGNGPGWNAWLTLPACVIVSGVIAYVLGSAMVRLPDLGVAMGSYFFAFVVIILLRGRTPHPLPAAPAEYRSPRATGPIAVSSGRGLYCYRWDASLSSC